MTKRMKRPWKPHSGGRPTGAPSTRSCILEVLNEDDIEDGAIPLRKPGVQEYRTALEADAQLREEFRDDPDEPLGPSYSVERGAPRGTGFHGRFRPGEVRSAA